VRRFARGTTAGPSACWPASSASATMRRLPGHMCVFFDVQYAGSAPLQVKISSKIWVAAHLPPGPGRQAGRHQRLGTPPSPRDPRPSAAFCQRWTPPSPDE
jgi:hypothetical protein